MEPIKQLSRSVAGRTVLITGAASGMGRAEAHLFAAEGAKVAVTDLDQARVDHVVDEIRAGGGEAQGWALDVRDDARMAHVVGATVQAFGGLDILINNAGLALICPIDGDDYDISWTVSMDVLLNAHMKLIRMALPYLRQSDAARVINIASTEGLGATPMNSAYVAAKHGVIGLTRGLAAEIATDTLTVNCICPGPIRTGITDGIPEDHKQKYARRRVPLARYGHPEEVAHIVLSVALPAASYLNGVAIPVDGGMIIKNA